MCATSGPALFKKVTCTQFLLCPLPMDLSSELASTMLSWWEYFSKVLISRPFQSLKNNRGPQLGFVSMDKFTPI